MSNQGLTVENLEAKAKQVRRLILDTTHRAKMGHTGGSLSEVEILVALYFRVMRNIDASQPGKIDRDRFILSKGHATPGYYSTLALRGYFPVSMLETFDQFGTLLQAHPDMHKAPGIDMSTGSLGQGLSCGIGMALAARIRPGLGAFRTFVLVGDGELQEGQIWEAVLFAGARKLPGLVAIVDANDVQLASSTRDAVDLDPIADKWRSFGWQTAVVDGHDLSLLVPALEVARESSAAGPVVVVAKTVKGKGVSFMEGRYEWHGKAPNDEEYARAIAEVGE
jgi:transketolase